MNDSRALPPEQEAIQAKCFPTGRFVEAVQACGYSPSMA